VRNIFSAPAYLSRNILSIDQHCFHIGLGPLYDLPRSLRQAASTRSTSHTIVATRLLVIAPFTGATRIAAPKLRIAHDQRLARRICHGDRQLNSDRIRHAANTEYLLSSLRTISVTTQVHGDAQSAETAKTFWTGLQATTYCSAATVPTF
jgi:hypothetical protein